MQPMIRTTPKDNKISLGFTHFAKNLAQQRNCWSLEMTRLNEENAPSQPKETFSENYLNRLKLPNNYISNSNDCSNAERCRMDSPYVHNRNHSRSNS